MNWEIASAMGEILGAIAVVVTVGYLAVQTRQNTAAMRASTRQAILDSDQQLIAYLLQNPDMEELRFKPELSDQEQARLAYFLVLFTRMREVNWMQYHDKVLDEVTWSSYSKTVGAMLGTEHGRRWWKRYAEDLQMFDPEFIEYVNAVLNATPVITESRLMRMFD